MKFISLHELGTNISHIYTEDLQRLCSDTRKSGFIPNEFLKLKEDLITSIDKDSDFKYTICKDCLEILNKKS